MWRFGVTTLSAARSKPIVDTDFCRYSLLLLKDLESEYRVDDEPLVARLYDEVNVSGKVYKTTRAGRFKELDPRIVETCAQHLREVAVLRVHDVGASNAITSLELFETLNADRAAFVRASDWFDALLLVRFERTTWTAVCDHEGNVIQYVSPKFVLSASEGESRRHPWNRWLLSGLQRRFEAIVSRQASGSLFAQAEKLTLWHPRCKGLARVQRAFTLARHDLFQPSEEKFHLIRAMNVLNPGYFPEDRLRLGFAHLSASLFPKGVLVVGRSFEERGGETHATAFAMTPDGLRELWRLGEGYERPDLVS